MKKIAEELAIGMVVVSVVLYSASLINDRGWPSFALVVLLSLGLCWLLGKFLLFVMRRR